MKRGGTKLGQNFLVDEAACVRIADALGDVRDRTVIEIGPGHGAITQHLAPRCRTLHLVELDPSLVRELSFRFRHQANVTVHHASILDTDFHSFIDSNTPQGTAGTSDIMGNLPYYITSEILLHLFAAARAGGLRRAVIMVQREVAERLVASPGSSVYGSLSALTQLHAQTTELFTLPQGAFSPPPDVFSTVVRLDFSPRFAELDIPFDRFNQFLRSSFAQKRKTLANNLRAAGHTASQLEQAWPPDLPPQVRSEAVPLDTLAALFKNLQRSTGPSA